MDSDQTIRLASGRTVGFADYGHPDDTAVIWCHGGPGSRLEPAYVVPSARKAGLRMVGIDRPGYGLSTPEPGRSIGGWVPDALAVADHLGVDRFVTVGVSTGGAFALAVAALADPIHARHTAAVIPGAELRIVDGLGHFSIQDQLIPAIIDVLARDT